MNIISDKLFEDIHNRSILLTDERLNHIENFYPEMEGQIDKIQETLLNPDVIIKSKTDSDIELFYQNYDVTPVTKKYFCIVVKILTDNTFIITAYFTKTIKKGAILWEKK